MMCKRKLCLLVSVMALIFAAQADTTVTFLDLNPVADGNTVNVGGSTNNLTVTRSGAGTVADNYVYTITYSNQSFDGDSTLDTLTFDLRFEAFSGSTNISTGASGTTTPVAATGTATIGSDQEKVVETTKAGGSSDSSAKQTWTVGNVNFDSGESLKVTLENFSVTTSTGSWVAGLGLFKSISMWEGGGNTHQTVVGEGTELKARNWSNNRNQDYIIPNINQSPILYVSQGNNTSPSAYNNWGLESFDFTVVVVPGPPKGTVILVM